MGRADDSALILFLHGGGFILGSLDSHDDICAELCAATGFNLVSVDYRLSPEYLHPVHLDDVEDAFLALEHENTILVGASAGGTLAAALSHRLKSSPVRAAGQVLIYPGLGGDHYALDSYRDNADAPLLSTQDITITGEDAARTGYCPSTTRNFTRWWPAITAAHRPPLRFPPMSTRCAMTRVAMS